MLGNKLVWVWWDVPFFWWMLVSVRTSWWGWNGFWLGLVGEHMRSQEHYSLRFVSCPWLLITPLYFVLSGWQTSPDKPSLHTEGFPIAQFCPIPHFSIYSFRSTFALRIKIWSFTILVRECYAFRRSLGPISSGLCLFQLGVHCQTTG